MKRKQAFKPALRTSLADEMRQFRAYHQWHNKLLLNPHARREEIAAVTKLALDQERRVIRLQKWRDGR